MNTNIDAIFYGRCSELPLIAAGNRKCKGDLLLSQSAIEEPLDHKDYYCKEHGN